MAKMKCRCGNIMSNVGCPNTLEGEIKGIYEYNSRSVWECGQCGNLWIEIDDPDVKGCHKQKCYIPENRKPGDIFNIGNGEQFLNYLKNLWNKYQKDLKNLEIIQDREPILNKCIQEYEQKLRMALDTIEELEEKIRNM